MYKQQLGSNEGTQGIICDKLRETACPLSPEESFPPPSSHPLSPSVASDQQVLRPLFCVMGLVASSKKM